MKSDNVIQTKSYAFAIKIVGVYKYLVEVKKEFTLSKQILRSGTSIGANVEEAIGGSYQLRITNYELTITNLRPFDQRACVCMGVRT